MHFVAGMIMTASLIGANLEPGDHRRTLTVEGREREYLLHLPKKRDGERWPVVLAFHGGGSNAEQLKEFTGLDAKSDEAGFAAVYPSGNGRLPGALSWNGGNCCGYAKEQEIDDVKFVAALLDDLATVVPLDDKRVFATGMSNGAIISYRLASELADRIAAIAPVAGPMGLPTCHPTRPVPVCHFHGTRDDFAPYAGGVGRKSITRTDFISVAETIRTWVKANGCNEKPTEETLAAKIDDGTQVKRAVYSGGKDGSEVILYTIEGMGHVWPGRKSPLRFLGTTTQNLSANDVMWEFFQKHGRK